MDLYERYHEIERLWTRQAWEEWERTTAPGYTFDPGVGPTRDLAGTLEWSRGLFRAFPDLTQTLEHVIVTGNIAVGVAVTRGTMTGPLDLGGGYELAPTGRPFELPYVKVITFDDAGLVAGDTQYLDADYLLRQIAG